MCIYIYVVGMWNYTRKWVPHHSLDHFGNASYQMNTRKYFVRNYATRHPHTAEIHSYDVKIFCCQFLSYQPSWMCLNFVVAKTKLWYWFRQLSVWNPIWLKRSIKWNMPNNRWMINFHTERIRRHVYCKLCRFKLYNVKVLILGYFILRVNGLFLGKRAWEWTDSFWIHAESRAASSFSNFLFLEDGNSTIISV